MGFLAFCKFQKLLIFNDLPCGKSVRLPPPPPHLVVYFQYVRESDRNAYSLPVRDWEVDGRKDVPTVAEAMDRFIADLEARDPLFPLKGIYGEGNRTH